MTHLKSGEGVLIYQLVTYQWNVLLNRAGNFPSLRVFREKGGVHLSDSGDGSQIGHEGPGLDKWMTHRVSSKTQIQLF